MSAQNVEGRAASAARPVAGRREWTRQGIRRERYLGYLFVAPMLIFLLLVVLFPLASVFVTSLYRESGVNVRFVGLGNYTRLVDDELFWNGLRVSVAFTVLAVLLHVAIGMPIALFLNQARRGQTALRLAMLAPWMMAPVIGAIIWVWLLDPHFGVVNYVLDSLGLIREYQTWLADPGLAFAAIIAVDVWRGFPFIMLIILAGLQAVPKDEYEAASIDGAGALARFRHITLPNLRYVLIVATTLDVINTIRAFDIIAVMTRGGPVNATEVLPVLIYNTAFLSNRFGPAAAIGVVLLFLLLVFSTVYILLLQPGRSSEGA